MTPPRISAIITAFRRPDIVKEAIRSALDQTYPVHEVIVVDDASGDATPDSVLAIPDPRVRLVTLTDNVGPAGAMNAGIYAATGDVVALLDSDDLWMPEKLAVQTACWLARDDRESILIASRILNEVNDEIIGTLPEQTMREDQHAADYLFVEDGLIQTGTMFLSRTLAAEVGFDRSTRRHSDPGFVLRLEAAGAKIVQVPEALTRWRSYTSADRVSTTPNLEASLRWLEVFRPYMSRKAAIAFRYRNHIRVLHRHDKWAAAILTLQAAAAGVLGWRDIRRKLPPGVRNFLPGS